MKCEVCFGGIQEHSHEGKVYWTEGHNAEPLVSGRCCDYCNGLVVSFRMFIPILGRTEDINSSGARLKIEKQRELLLMMASVNKEERDRGEEE